MPGIQSCKNCFILTSPFEGLVQTACSHHGPSAKLSVYLIFTSAVVSGLVIFRTGYSVEGVRKKWPFQYIRSKVCQATSPYLAKSNKSQTTICAKSIQREPKNPEFMDFSKRARWNWNQPISKESAKIFWIINHCQNCWRIFPLFDLLKILVWWVMDVWILTDSAYYWFDFDLYPI